MSLRNVHADRSLAGAPIPSPSKTQKPVAVPLPTTHRNQHPATSKPAPRERNPSARLRAPRYPAQARPSPLQARPPPAPVTSPVGVQVGAPARRERLPLFRRFEFLLWIFSPLLRYRLTPCRFTQRRIECQHQPPRPHGQPHAPPISTARPAAYQPAADPPPTLERARPARVAVRKAPSCLPPAEPGSDQAGAAPQAPMPEPGRGSTVPAGLSRCQGSPIIREKWTRRDAGRPALVTRPPRP